MNKFLYLALSLTMIAGSSVLGAERFTAAAWAGVQSYEVSEMQKLRQFKVGQMVEIKFNYRNKAIGI